MISLCFPLLLPLLGSTLAHTLDYPHQHHPRPSAHSSNPFRWLVSRTRSPYSYQRDPLARVAFRPENSGLYMLGEEFFKQDWEQPSQELEGYDDDTEQMPYDVVQNYGTYELREYPSASMVCTALEEDTAEDPLANLENANPWRIMQSKRYQKTPASIMFKRLYRYISGVNQEGQEVEMTRPVSVFVKVEKKDDLGDLVKKVMCFYLPSKYQPGHTHQGGITGVRVKPAPRHAAIPAPQPMEGSDVFLYTRPEAKVYARRFGGFAMTAETWKQEWQLLMADLIGKQVKDDEYFALTYNSPMQMENRRNEILVESTKDGAADFRTVLNLSPCKRGVNPTC